MTILRSGDVIIRKLEIADPEVMRIAIRKEITRSDESRCDHRLHGLPLVTGGHSCRQMPALFGEDRRTVQRWVKRFESHGLDGVRKIQRSGRNAKQWAGLDAGPQYGNTQPFLRRVERPALCNRTILRSLATFQFGAVQVMRHYLGV